MTQTHEERIQQGLEALLQLSKAVIETVQEAGDQGAPSGVLYAALMTAGLSLEQYERLMAILVDAGKVRKSGHLYFAVAA